MSNLDANIDCYNGSHTVDLLSHGTICHILGKIVTVPSICFLFGLVFCIITSFCHLDQHDIMAPAITCHTATPFTLCAYPLSSEKLLLTGTFSAELWSKRPTVSLLHNPPLQSVNSWLG